MVLAPLVAQNQGTQGGRYGVYIDGLRVDGANGSRYGVNPATMAVRTVQAEGASSCSFTITDPMAEVALVPRATVVIEDIVYGVTIFRGWLDGWQARRLGSVERELAVTATGIESALDWMYVPPVTIASGTMDLAGILLLAGIAYGAGIPLRVDTSSATGTLAAGTSSAAAWAWAGGTLRAALTAWMAYIDTLRAPFENAGLLAPQVTVDPYYRLTTRPLNFMAGGGLSTVGSIPPTVGLWTTVSIGWDGYPSSTVYGIRSIDAPTQAYVVGGSAAGTGMVGSGQMGGLEVITDATVTDAQALYRAGYGAISAGAASASGRVTWEGATTAETAGDPATAWAVYAVSVLDPAAGIPTTSTFRVTDIEKTFAASGEQTWTFTFGARLASAAQYLRNRIS